MAVQTTTIRVPRSTRDNLAAVAAGRGVSVAQLLTEQSAAWLRNDWFRRERESGRTNAVEPDTRSEQDLWDETDDDWD